MQIKETSPGKPYAVTSIEGCTVYVEVNGTLEEFESVEPNSQKRFIAPAEQIHLSDDSALFTEVFKLAPAAIGSGGTSWYTELMNGLAEILPDRSSYVVAAADGKLVVYTDRADDTQIEAVTSLLEQVVPQNVEAETVNRDFRIPMNYKQVEYLQSRRYTAINTGIYATRNTETEIDNLIIVATNWGVVFSANGKYTLGTFGDNNTTILQYYNGTQYVRIPRPEEIALNNRFKAKVTKAGLYINETLRGTIPESVPFFTCDSPMVLSGYSVTGTDGAQAKYYSFSMSEDGEKLLDFIPCLDETGAPCMFDVVSKKAFYNIGSGEFLYPTERTTYALRHTLPDWGKLTERGLRRLYHAPEDYTGELYDYAVENGYKPIIEPDMPEEGYWEPVWRDREDCIELEWVETEPPTEDTELTEELTDETE